MLFRGNLHADCGATTIPNNQHWYCQTNETEWWRISRDDPGNARQGTESVKCGEQNQPAAYIPRISFGSFDRSSQPPHHPPKQCRNRQDANNDRGNGPGRHWLGTSRKQTHGRTSSGGLVQEDGGRILIVRRVWSTPPARARGSSNAPGVPTPRGGSRSAALLLSSAETRSGCRSVRSANDPSTGAGIVRR
jgi:hypothetical protein